MNPSFAIFLMALSTYLIRVFPMILLKEKIKNPMIQSFLHYIPYSILTAMIIPDLFTTKLHPIAAITGTLVALCLAWFEKSLITVSLIAVIAAYAVELIY